MTRSETARKNSLDDASAHLSPVFSVPSTSAVWSPARPSVSVVVADSQETVAPETEEEENVDAAENVAAANKARKADSSTLQDSESEYEEIEVEVEVDSDGNEIEAVEDQADLVVVADGDGVERNEEEKLELDAANVDVTEEEQKAEEANGRMVDKEARKDSSKEEVDVHEVAESENAMAADNAPATNYLVKTTPFDSIIEDSDLEEDFTAKVLNVNARVDESDEPVTLIPRIEPEFRDDDSEMDATQPYQETFATVEEEQDDEDMEQPESEDEAMPTNGQEDEEPESELEIPEEEEEEEEDDDDDTKTTLVDTQVPLIPVAHTPPASKTPFPTPAVAPLTNSPAKGTSPLPSPMARRSNYSTTVTNLGANAIPHHLRYQPAQRTLSTASMKLSTLANSNLFGGGAGRPPSLKEMSNAFGMDGLGNGGSLLNGLGAGHAQSDVSSAWVGGAAGVSGGRIAHGDDDSDDDSDVAGAADESSDDSSSDDDDDSDGDESDGNGIRAANKAGGPQFAGAEKRKKRRKSALSMLAMDGE
ncbi:hypothetical protein BC830DRAFT_670442 [Chytriomyces sp. MP71]|nr:hypothetical protein BC830DRAFT_670442 [Chytriomyces sp. MP71]